MPNYTKLFNSIITSTIWTEDDKTRIMWITMLAMSDKNGEVHGSIPGMARLAGMSISDAELSIGKLMSPDAYSRTPDNEGRRIAAIDGGWEILNHGKYRLMASKEDEKAATAERVRRHRSRNAKVTPCNGGVTACNGGVTVGRDIADTDTDTEAGKEPPSPLKGEHKKSLKLPKTNKGSLQELRSYAREIGLPESDGESMFDHWESNGWRNGSSPVKNWQAGIRKWKSQGWLPSQKQQANGHSSNRHRRNEYPQEQLELP